MATVALGFTAQFKAISECRQMKFFQPEIQNKHSCNDAPEPVRQALSCCGQREVLREVMGFRRKKKGKSKVLSGRFCLHDLEAEQRHYNSCIFFAQM